MSEVRHIFQRLAFELRALGVKEPIEVYVGEPGFGKLYLELIQTQRVPDNEGILLYDAVRVLPKEPLDYDKRELKEMRRRVTDKLVLLAKQVQDGFF